MHRGTEFLGCDVAIMGGAMSWISERHLVSAISNAGGFGVIACGAMSPELLDTEIAETKARTDRPFGVNLITMHPQLSELIDVCAKHQRRPCRARRRAAAGRRDRADQGERREADLLRAGARAGEEADALGRRRAGDRGHGGRRPYRPGLDLGPGAGDPAQRRQGHSGVRRRRDRPRRGDRRLSRNGRGRRPARHALRLRARDASPTPISRRRSSAPRPATRFPRCRSTRACR